MITIVTGLPGASKSYMAAQQAVEWVERNKKWYKKTGKIRKVCSNLDLAPSFKEYAGEFFETWEDPEELPDKNNCDVIWEEMGAHVDSRSWEQLPMSLRRWLQQHRHRGVEIHGNCQDYSDIDVAIRRLTGRLVYLVKFMGSRDPSPTTPPPKWIWGIVCKFELDPRKFKEDERFMGSAFAGLELIDRKGIELYSMFNDIKAGKYPPLQHRKRDCPDCGYSKVVHI